MLLEDLLEEFTCVTCGVKGDFFGSSFDQELSTSITTFWSEIDDPVSRLDHVELVFNDENSVPFICESMKDFEELFNVREVESCCGFIEDIEGAPCGATAELFGEFDTLGFSTREGRRRLSKSDVAETHILQGLEFSSDVGDGVKERQAFLDSHTQDLCDVFAFVKDLKSLSVKALPFASLTSDEDVWQKVHLDADDSSSFTFFAATTFDIE